MAPPLPLAETLLRLAMLNTAYAAAIDAAEATDAAERVEQLEQRSDG